MVTIEVEPGYKPKGADDHEQLALAKRIGPKEVEFTTALEAVENSRGLYRIRPDEPTRSVDPIPSTMPFGRLEDRSNEDLKLMMLNLGIRTEKQMRRSDIIRLINTKLEAVEILPEEDLTPDEDAIEAEAEAARVAERKAAEAGAVSAAATTTTAERTAAATTANRTSTSKKN